uniref:PiggyBac transposable element-derived protein domain-containing protein n=1 Tax=Haptolina brevifila TaxID=156173 RepID=A0A7S2N7I1_9EUKA|mmetsp:Transcript_69043/g.136855  ORF Transcript_69043/g.136855 Transcript_69043/m.136855 type:complete len:102 (+) Transcript_69043:315-620(+)
MWECYRVQMVRSVQPSYILCLDECMVKWLGRGMPGLIVVPRKLTPMGLEIHTVCDGLSGIMINFEIYEGKERMEKKEYMGWESPFGAIGKSTALTLCVTKP